MYFLPLRVINGFNNRLAPELLNKCYQIYAQEMTNLHIGQGLDICWHSKLYQHRRGTCVILKIQIDARTYGPKLSTNVWQQDWGIGQNERQVKCFALWRK
jgi:hypothetical protein